MVLRRLVLPRSALRASASAVPLSSDCTMRPRLLNSSSTAWWVGTDTMSSPCAMAVSSAPCTARPNVRLECCTSETQPHAHHAITVSLRGLEVTRAASESLASLLQGRHDLSKLGSARNTAAAVNTHIVYHIHQQAGFRKGVPHQAVRLVIKRRLKEREG